MGRAGGRGGRMNAPHFTSEDLDALTYLQVMPGYRLLRDRLESELARKRADLEGNLDAVATAACRGRISALKTALDIPDILRDEMKIAIARDEANGV
jgi:hypothetical protein